MRFLAKFLLICFLLIPLQASALWVYVDESRAGEKSMAEGIQRALITKDPAFPITFIDSENPIDPGSQDKMLLAIGKAGIDFIKKNGATLKQKGWRVTHLTHQLFENEKEIYPLADSVFLPAYLKGTQQQQALLPSTDKVVWTNGVPYNLTKTKVEQEYAAHKAELPSQQKPLIVILGGDTEALDRSVHFYTKADAEKLADYITQTYKGSPVLVLNGPRTGKHSPDTGKVIETAHREGVVDNITAAFANRLDEYGQSYTIFDFQFGKPSLYQASLGLALEKGTPILIPGESNSMLADAESLGLLPQVICYLHPAMNPLNHENVKYLQDQDGLVVLDENMELQPSKTPLTSELMNPNEEVAAVLFESQVKLTQQ